MKTIDIFLTVGSRHCACIIRPNGRSYVAKITRYLVQKSDQGDGLFGGLLCDSYIRSCSSSSVGADL